jgi:hypothetical protein
MLLDLLAESESGLVLMLMLVLVLVGRIGIAAVGLEHKPLLVDRRVAPAGDGIANHDTVVREAEHTELWENTGLLLLRIVVRHVPCCAASGCPNE